MKKLLEFIIENITGSKDLFEVTETIDPETESKIELKVIADPKVMGLIIGKGGNTVKAIRQILKTRAIIEKKIVFLEVIDKSS